MKIVRISSQVPTPIYITFDQEILAQVLGRLSERKENILQCGTVILSRRRERIVGCIYKLVEPRLLAFSWHSLQPDLRDCSSQVCSILFRLGDRVSTLFFVHYPIRSFSQITRHSLTC